MRDIFDVIDDWYRRPEPNKVVDEMMERINQLTNKLGRRPSIAYVPMDVYVEFECYMHECEKWRVRVGINSWERHWNGAYVYRVVTKYGEVKVEPGYGYMVR